MMFSEFLLYMVAVGFPSLFALRWAYHAWWHVKLPALRARLNRQRRRDKVIRETRDTVVDLVTRMAAAEEAAKEAAKEAAETESADDESPDPLVDCQNRLGTLERTIAQLQHRLRQKGINIDG